MSTDTPAQPLRAAAQAVLDRWDSPQWQWTQQGPTADLMADLRRALDAQPAQELPNYAGPKDCPDEAWNLALKVRSDLDRISCPGVYMDKAVEAICKRWSAAPTQAAQEPVAFSCASRTQDGRACRSHCGNLKTCPATQAAPAAAPNLACKSVQARLAAQWGYVKAEQATPAEPDMRHPKIQALIGAKARREIELQLVEQLLDEGPDCDVSAMGMEYWHGLHNKLRDKLRAATPVAELVEALRALVTLFAPLARDSTQKDWIGKAEAALARHQEKP